MLVLLLLSEVPMTLSVVAVKFPSLVVAVDALSALAGLFVHSGRTSVSCDAVFLFLLVVESSAIQDGSSAVSMSAGLLMVVDMKLFLVPAGLQ